MMQVAVKKFLEKIRLLTLLILVASVSFMVRIGDAYTNIRALSGEAQAEEVKKSDEAAAATTKEEVKAADAKAEDKGTAPAETEKKVAEPSSTALATAEEDKAADEKKDDKPAEGDAAGEDKPGNVTLPSTEVDSKKWTDPIDDDAEFPEIKKEMYQDLLKRRQELDDKEKKISQREALVEAAQKEIDRKYGELESLKGEIQGLLKKQTEEEDARITSLVKIYSGMKPKDAARIFNTLDMDVLLSVVSKMPESKSALIIANMDADPARTLTTMLAEQRKMPELPQ